MRKRAEIERDASEAAKSDPAFILGPHALRPIRAFLAHPGEAEAAFWAVIYGDGEVSHETALAVAAELEHSTVKIERLLAGWRPRSLVFINTEK